jgi:hypothetical protein
MKIKNHNTTEKVPSKGFFNSNTLLVILSLWIGLLLIDSLISDVSSIVNQTVSEGDRIIFFSFSLIVIIFTGAYAVYHFSKKVDRDLGSNVSISLISKVVPAIQILIIIILLLILVEIILHNQYSVYLFTTAIVLSLTAGGFLMGLLTIKFLRWYFRKKSLIILLYLASSLLFTVILASTIIPQALVTLQTSPSYIGSHSIETKFFQAKTLDLEPFLRIISTANWLVIPLALVLWASTILMLYPYMKNNGSKKLHFLLYAPLVSFVIGNIFLMIFLPTINSIFDSEVIFYTMLAFGSILTEGFLLGLAFVTLAKKVAVSVRNKIQDYLKISAIGIISLFICFFANPSSGSYLPFGLLSVSFFSFASYLFFVGVYSSAITISSDLSLRRTLRISVLDQSKFLDNIAIADLNEELETHIDNVIKNHDLASYENEEKKGLSEQDIKNYALEILEELRSRTSK